ncbi:hypothetical protein JOF29_007915 [Kribbella aluminosa]|uniref:Uncharacterized protein n=1 Tax=Kribbella aluminosa TaxID=416017 RepID=A0ABS4UYT4_9ACTN|nr:hypothetical protein [Kribbella aluminosa]
MTYRLHAVAARKLAEAIAKEPGESCRHCQGTAGACGTKWWLSGRRCCASCDHTPSPE